MIERAKRFAAEAHAGQEYGGRPYAESHLPAVVRVLEESGVTDPEVLAAGWLHDVLEDTEASPIDLHRQFGILVFHMVRACTGVGKDRKQRNATIYRGIWSCPSAAVVKLADRIANVEAAAPGSRHMHRYRNEQRGFEAAIRPHVPAAMWERLERALTA
jgi:(p)ppGpp synthase/HD superfamily hydrolase